MRPRRADAARNRQALVAAARRVFERDGFVTARITDIADEAGLAHGSFYPHFQSKEDALAAVLGEVEEEMLHPGVGRSAYVTFALGREPAGLEVLADTLTRLWTNALRLTPYPGNPDPGD
jgi:AcrR family transcriptional regulator